MHKYLLYAASSAALAMATLPQAASAKDGAGASDSVIATAILEREAPPLEVTAKSALSFGTINVPNGLEPGHACRYNVSVFGADGLHALAELDASGVVVDTDAPTASACNWGASGVPDTEYGTFSIVCSPSTNVTYSALYASEGVAGVVFGAPVSGTVIAARNSDASESLKSSLTTTLDHACTQSGQLDISLGASVTIDANADVAASPVTIGSITLDATY